jgi:hypothetical protein
LGDKSIIVPTSEPLAAVTTSRIPMGLGDLFQRQSQRFCSCTLYDFFVPQSLGPLVADVVVGKPAQPLLRLNRPSLSRIVSANDPISR